MDNLMNDLESNSNESNDKEKSLEHIVARWKIGTNNIKLPLIDQYITKYNVRSVDDNNNDGMNMATAMSYFINAIKDNSKYNDTFLNKAEVLILEKCSPKNIIIVDTVVYKDKNNILFKQIIVLEQKVVAKSESTATSY